MRSYLTELEPAFAAAIDDLDVACGRTTFGIPDSGYGPAAHVAPECADDYRHGILAHLLADLRHLSREERAEVVRECGQLDLAALERPLTSVPTTEEALPF